MNAPAHQQHLHSRKVALCGRGATRGAFLVEVIIASAVAVTVAAFIAGTVSLFVTVRANLINEARNLYAAEEGYEIMRYVRDDDWTTISSLTVGRYYGLSVGTTTLAIDTTPETLASGAVRTVVVRSLYRAADGEVVPEGTSGATLDTAGRMLEVHVADTSGTTTLRAVLTNLFGT